MVVTSPVLSLLISLSVPVAERLPNFETARNCEAELKAVGSSQGQTIQQCVADENSARAEIETQWAQFSANLRDRCISETQVGGSPSYVDVLECLRLGASK
jgi:hypothetical protein